MWAKIEDPPDRCWSRFEPSRFGVPNSAPCVSFKSLLKVELQLFPPVFLGGEVFQVWTRTFAAPYHHLGMENSQSRQAHYRHHLSFTDTFDCTKKRVFHGFSIQPETPRSTFCELLCSGCLQFFQLLQLSWQAASPSQPVPALGTWVRRSTVSSADALNSTISASCA